MRLAVGLWLTGVTLAGCGSSPLDANDSIVCSELQAKHDECETGIDLASQCDASNLPQELECAYLNCSLNATCEVFTSYAHLGFLNNDLVACFSDCGVSLTDEFYCADGSGLTLVQFVCDGESNCPDASDEATCT